VAGNFNRCFEIAVQRGADVAAILHADDVLEPDYVAVMRAAHARHPDVACVAPGVTVIDASGRTKRTVADTVKGWLWPNRLHTLTGERGLQLLLRGQFFYCPAVSYRLALVDHPAWSDRWDQVMDLDLYARVLLNDGSIALEPSKVYRYRRHGGTATEANSASLLRTQEETDMLRLLARSAADRGWSVAAREARWRITVRLQALLRMAGSLLHGRWRHASSALRLAVASGR
jgi:hypothetical protein